MCVFVSPFSKNIINLPLSFQKRKKSCWSSLYNNNKREEQEHISSTKAKIDVPPPFILVFESLWIFFLIANNNDVDNDEKTSKLCN